MRRVVVTGANKGIGLAIARGVLKEHEDTYLFLGSRDAGRGRAALDSLIAEDGSFAGRSSVLEIDVSRDESVAKAADVVREVAAGDDRPLYGLVNNAGVGFGDNDLRSTLNVNARGIFRVCEAFLPLIDVEGGRIVNVTSAAGPNFVAECSPERQRFFLDPDTDWDALEALMSEALAIEGGEPAFAEKGLGTGNPYGLSKACANTYTLHLANAHPGLLINAVTPGFIATDLTRHYVEAQGKDPKELGMRTPDEGARAPLHLLFGELDGTGRYYGSDAKRSPLHRYRSPGSPEYTGD